MISRTTTSEDADSEREELLKEADSFLETSNTLLVVSLMF